LEHSKKKFLSLFTKVQCVLSTWSTPLLSNSVSYGLGTRLC